MLRLQGGLGNQLFQLVALRYVSRLRSNATPAIFPDHLGLFKTKRELAIQPFFLGEKIVHKINGVDDILFRTKLSRLMSRIPVHAAGSVKQLHHWKGRYLDGYFQDIYNYPDTERLKEEIRKIDLVTRKYIDEKGLQSTPGKAAVHLRLTDFVKTKKQHDYLVSSRLPYIQKSMDWLRKHKGVKGFTVFSDSPAAAKRFMGGDDVVYYRDTAAGQGNLFHEFCELCTFPYMVGSNSTFSFWAALLGRDKQVIFPAQWDKLRPLDNRIFEKNLAAIDRYAIHHTQTIRLHA